MKNKESPSEVALCSTGIMLHETKEVRVVSAGDETKRALLLNCSLLYRK
jgi:hypothetical protein